jgi:hypothetical protein
MRGRPTKDPYTRPAINTLERLHAEVGGKILENRQERDSLAEQMRHVEAVNKMLDPGYSLRAISVKRRKPTWRKVGELLNLFSEEEGANYLKNSGYVSV